MVMSAHRVLLPEALVTVSLITLVAMVDYLKTFHRLEFKTACFGNVGYKFKCSGSINQRPGLVVVVTRHRVHEITSDILSGFWQFGMRSTKVSPHVLEVIHGVLLLLFR